MKVISLNEFYHIKIGMSKQLLDGYFERYNRDKKLSDKLRSQHKNLTGLMIYYYAQAVKKAQTFGAGLDKGQDLPSLRTNNVQLSRKLGVCEKTVRNLRKRLTQAKIILDTVSHGHNSSFELILNPGIIHISSAGDPSNMVLYFSKNYTPTPDSSGPKRKTLPHTVSSTVQELIKLSKLEGVEIQQSADIQSIGSFENVDNVSDHCGQSTQIAENQQTKPTQGTQEPFSGNEDCKAIPETSPQVAKHPPQERPKNIMDVISHLAPEIQEKIKRIVTNLMIIAKINLYANGWLSDQEEERGKAVLAEYFAYSNPKNYSTGSNEITTRMILVKGWLDRREKQGKTGWNTPIPSVYFDFRNKNGFIKTKAWYKDHKKVRNEITRKTALTKAVNQYLKSFDTDSLVNPTEAYRRISQQLGKKSPLLLDLFNQQILEIKKTA